MPKLVTAKRIEGEHEKAVEYVKTHILFPSGLLGLICLVAGAGTLIYQFVVEAYSWFAFSEVTGLLVVGGLLGWGQTRYHKYLVREHPEHFASRMKLYSRSSPKRTKKEGNRMRVCQDSHSVSLRPARADLPGRWGCNADLSICRRGL